MSLKSSATFRYTGMRLGIFAGCFLVMWALVYFRVVPAGLGASNLFWVVLLALIVSAPLSFVLLRKQREAMAVQVAERVDRAKERLAASQSQEDASSTSSSPSASTQDGSRAGA
ncbi:DUF4229 domain-containing protein [Streptomyces sp. NEAU-S77]|uniref:DUF4229 domain-containing protein n=1 Tax=Streptomyces sp. NEAU-S77 TaxID=3411033 RepID=UPI003B9EF84E